MYGVADGQGNAFDTTSVVFQKEKKTGKISDAASGIAPG